MRKIYLVACSKEKQDSGFHRAEDLYTSQLFKLARAYAEYRIKADATREGSDCWAILSAKHGLLFKWQEVEPYEQSMRGMEGGQFVEWIRNTTGQIITNFGPGKNTTFVMLAGSDYAGWLSCWLEHRGATVERPLAHLGIGQQKAWFKKNIASEVHP